MFIVYYITCVQQNSMREWLSWWSATLPRSRPRVRVPSRALKTKRMMPKGIVLFCFPECGTDNKQHARQPPHEISLTTVFGGGWNEMRKHFVCSTVPSMRSGSRSRAPRLAQSLCLQLFFGIIENIC